MKYQFDKPVTFRIYLENGKQRVISGVEWTSTEGNWMLIGTVKQTILLNSDKVNLIEAEDT